MSDSGTIDYFASLMVFLGSMVSATSPALAIGLPVSSHLDVSIKTTALDTDIQHCANLTFRVTLEYNANNQFRNINLTSIDYAFRPRLRID